MFTIFSFSLLNILCNLHLNQATNCFFFLFLKSSSLKPHIPSSMTSSTHTHMDTSANPEQFHFHPEFKTNPPLSHLLFAVTKNRTKVRNSFRRSWKSHLLFLTINLDLESYVPFSAKNVHKMDAKMHVLLLFYLSKNNISPILLQLQHYSFSKIGFNILVKFTINLVCFHRAK